MSERVLMKGNDAIAEAAIRAGCTAYYGYPITPQNELIATMAKRMVELGRVFIQAESEVAAVNMCYGSAAAGSRTMTSSSGPGLSLKQEGISYACGADLPMVVVNIQRAGPGLGGIAPSQADYFQATRGGGHGDYRTPVLAPKSVQEACDLTTLAFEIADKYRTPVLILADGLLGQMMEGIVLPPMRDPASLPSKADWKVGGQAETHRPARHISSLDLNPKGLEARNLAREARYAEIAAGETRWEEVDCADAELVLVAYGSSARVALGAVRAARKAGLKAGLLRPITLWPFPTAPIAALAKRGARFLAVEMSHGQMMEDVKMAAWGAVAGAEVGLIGHSGGVVPTEDECYERIARTIGGRP